MKSKKLVIILAAVCVACALIIYKVHETKTDAKQVEISQTKLSLEVSKSHKIYLKNAEETVKWESKNKEVATVSNQGTVKAIGKGNTDIVATYKEKQYVAHITVTLPKVAEVKELPSTGKYIYITVDDGPSAGMQTMLNILKEKDVKATFFVTGQFKKYFPLLKVAYEQGHAIEAHTYSHEYSIYKSEETYFKDLDKIQNLITKETGRRATYIRFPGGSSNAISRKYNKGIMTKLVKAVKNRGYKYMDWNASTNDAGGVKLSPAQIVRNSTSSERVVVLLMHDVLPHSSTIKALPKIIDYYKSKGYKFVTTYDYDYTCHHHVNN